MSASAGLAVDPRRGIRFLVMAAALVALGPMSFDFYLPSFPAISADLGVPVSSVQLTLSAALLGMGLGQLIYGPLTDRFGRKSPVLVGLAIFTIASVGCAMAPTLGWLLAFRIVQALGGCAGVVGSRAMTRDLYDGRDLAKAMSLIFLIFGVAPVLSPILGSLVLGWTSWRGLFVVLTGYGIALALAVMLFPETHPESRRTNHGFVDGMRAYIPVGRNPVVLLSALIQMVTGAALFSFVSGSPAVFLEHDGLPNAVFLGIFGGVSLSLFVMSQVNVRLLQRWGPRQIMAAVATVQFLAALGLLASAVAGWPVWTFVAFLMVAIAGVGFMMPNSTATALEPYPQAAGVAAAIVGSLGMLGGAAWAAGTASIPVAAPTAMALGIALATLISLVLARWLRGHTADPEAVTTG